MASKGKPDLNQENYQSRKTVLSFCLTFDAAWCCWFPNPGVAVSSCTAHEVVSAVATIAGFVSNHANPSISGFDRSRTICNQTKRSNSAGMHAMISKHKSHLMHLGAAPPHTPFLQ